MTEKNAQTECLHCSHIDGRIKHAKTCPKREPIAEPKPASDEELAQYKEWIERGPLSHPLLSYLGVVPKLIARIEQDRATVERLEKREADLVRQNALLFTPFDMDIKDRENTELRATIETLKAGHDEVIAVCAKAGVHHPAMLAATIETLRAEYAQLERFIPGREQLVRERNDLEDELIKALAFIREVTGASPDFLDERMNYASYQVDHATMEQGRAILAARKETP